MKNVLAALLPGPDESLPPICQQNSASWRKKFATDFGLKNRVKNAFLSYYFSTANIYCIEN